MLIIRIVTLKMVSESHLDMSMEVLAREDRKIKFALHPKMTILQWHGYSYGQSSVCAQFQHGM